MKATPPDIGLCGARLVSIMEPPPRPPSDASEGRVSNMEKLLMIESRIAAALPPNTDMPAPATSATGTIAGTQATAVVKASTHGHTRAQNTGRKMAAFRQVTIHTLPPNPSEFRVPLLATATAPPPYSETPPPVRQAGHMALDMPIPQRQQPPAQRLRNIKRVVGLSALTGTLGGLVAGLCVGAIQVAAPGVIQGANAMPFYGLLAGCLTFFACVISGLASDPALKQDRARVSALHRSAV